MLTTDRSAIFALPSDIMMTRCSRSGDLMISGQLLSTCPSSSSSLDKASTQVSKGDRYKTELCRTFEENGSCRYGDKCQFAHGIGEMRNVNRHPKYKTDLCRTFHTTGFCPYGARCHFIHGDYKQMMTSSSCSSTSTSSSSSAVRKQSSVESKQSRVGDVGRLLNGLDDELLLALASLIQRQQVTSQQRATLADRHLLQSASMSDSVSPCPSPSSVFGSGSSDGMCSPSPVGTTSPMINHPFQLSKTRCYSGCDSPDSATSSMFNNWIHPKESGVLRLSSSCQLPSLSTSMYTTSHSLNKATRSIFV